ncbi:related to Phosphotransferase enzyme family domain protein [Melanopsichium pennsylvanicum]|uniref:Related to Phosphotransferase enzyme family domain protein n=1 Tax=Melanopsichium pennsylvanicum TaxID=63383 RepID=A0AAJ4XRU2_9BASI|nr:related to Phosphotransferase enzyme family domain protein [Melanopsichium pennsylvanicum]
MSEEKIGQNYGEVRHAFDVQALNAYLEANVTAIATPVNVKQFSFGQSNPTYILFDRNHVRYVLRKKPPGSLLSSTAHAVEREYRILKSLHTYTASLAPNSPDRVPVPKVFCLCEDNNIVGTAFYIMEFINGRIFEDYRFLQLPKSQRTLCWMSAIDTLAALHRISPSCIGLADYGKSSGFYTRQMKSLAKVSAIQSQVEEKHTPGKKVGRLPGIEKFLAWFENNMPKDQNTIVHGDYKIDNLIFHPTEPRVIGILDWELSTLGHPLSDLANLLQPFSTPCKHSKQEINDTQLWEKSRREGNLLLALGNLNQETCPIPTEDKLIKRYCEKLNRSYPIENWTAAKAWAWFRLAVISQGIAARNAQGQASSAQAKVYGSKFPLCANACFVVIETDQANKANL